MKNTIPYNFEELFQELEHPGSSQRLTQNYFDDINEVEASITQFLEMLLLTKCGEFYLDRNFGFKFWEHIFNNISVDSFKSNMFFHIPTKKEVKLKYQTKITPTEFRKDDYIKLLKEVIEKYEVRLSNININFDIELEIGYKLFKYLIVVVSGKIDDKYPYKHEFDLKIGPIEKKY